MFLTIPQVDFAAKVQAQQEFETYESEEFGFTIEHPFDWKPSEPSSFEIEMIGHVPYVIKFELPGSLNDDVYVRKWRPAVTVYVDILQGLTSLEEYVSEQIDSRVVSFASKINSTDTILSGNPAYKLNSTQPGGNIKTMSIYAMNDEGRIYSLDYSAHEATFDTYLPIVQKMIDSFKIYTNTSESQSNAAQGQEPEVSLQNNSTPEEDSMAQSEFTIGEEMVEEEPSAELESEEAIDNTGRGNQSQPVQWLTHDDPILQIKIDYPSNWDKRECPDSVMFGPDYFRIDLEVEMESLFPSTDTPQKYMREVLNENREYQMDIIGLNETTVNDYPAYRAQYKIGDSITLSYFIVDKNDYTGYHIEYDAEEKYFSKYLPDIERMVNSFQITK